MQFKTVFSSFKDVKVIQFSSMQDAFLGFADKVSLFVSLSFGFIFAEPVDLLSYFLLMLCEINLCSDKGREIQESHEAVCWYMVLCG